MKQNSDPWEIAAKERSQSNRVSYFSLFCIIILLCISLAFLALRLHSVMEESVSLREKVSTYKGAYEYKTSQVESLEAEIDLLTVKISEKENELNAASTELNFWEDFAVLVTSTGGKYHRYNCQYVQERAFWIYNVETAKYLDYTPCSVCNPPTSAPQQSGVVSRYTGQ